MDGLTDLYRYDQLTQTLHQIVDSAVHVKIQWDRVPELAEWIKKHAVTQQIAVPAWADPQGHADEFPPENTLDTIQYFFCLVPQSYQHYILNEKHLPDLWGMTVLGKYRTGVHAQYACAVRAQRRGVDLLNPNYLVTMPLADVEEFYRDELTGEPNISDLAGRQARFNEIGQVLLERYQRHFANMLKTAGGYLFRDDGNGILQQLVREFPLSYGDWPFCKLSMSPARMLYDRRRPEIPAAEEYLALTDIRDMDHFEAGADVARPFALIRMGVIEIDASFQEKLRLLKPLSADAREYQEARAATMLICRQLVEQSGVSSPHIGGELWSTGFYNCPVCRPAVADTTLTCIYKPICRAYQLDSSLFALYPMIGTGD